MDTLFHSFNCGMSVINFTELSACVFSWLEEHCKPQVTHIYCYSWLDILIRTQIIFFVSFRNHADTSWHGPGYSAPAEKSNPNEWKYVTTTTGENTELRNYDWKCCIVVDILSVCGIFTSYFNFVVSKRRHNGESSKKFIVQLILRKIIFTIRM